jgi:hypothetical protein
VLSGEAANTNFVVFGLTPEKFEDSKEVIRSVIVYKEPF